MSKKFDLNIEEILESWEIYHAVREIIANALDEKLLSKSKDIEIFKDSENKWHIRDFGRGLRCEHLTQNENEEKLLNPNTIGKFGVGLKDALATLHRKGVKVLIKSKFNDISIEMARKEGFTEITTLHAIIDPPSQPDIIGTDFILENICDNEIIKAKSLFIQYSGLSLIETTKYGEVYKNENETNKPSCIFINGVKVNQEPNFLFSYNITSLNKKIKDALNRERSNVGRDAYSDRVKSILLECKSEKIALMLTKDLEKCSMGENHDELNWIDIQTHATKIINASKPILFVTPEEIQNNFKAIDDAKKRGMEIIPITEKLKDKISFRRDINDKPIRNLEVFNREENESFEFKFIDPNDLTENERAVFNLNDKILEIIGGRPQSLKEIKISETMRKDPSTFQETAGLWQKKEGRIIIKRSRLKSLNSYCRTFLHEIAHCTSGEPDVSRKFEEELSQLLGKITAQFLMEKNKN